MNPLILGVIAYKMKLYRMIKPTFCYQLASISLVE